MVHYDTPSTTHVSYDKVYEPAEDSFFLLDTLSSPAETAFLHSRFSGRDSHSYESCLSSSASPTVVEIGPGSGVVLSFLTRHAGALFGRSDVLTLGVDVNVFACDATVQTAQHAVSEPQPHPSAPGIFVDCLNGSLGTPLRPHSVDVLVFNPPYVPTETVPESIPTDYFSASAISQKTALPFADETRLLELSYAGGPDGMVITDELLDQLPDLLTLDRGVAYVLLCARNKPDVVRDRMDRSLNTPGDRQPSWDVQLVSHSGRATGWERLSILRLARV